MPLVRIITWCRELTFFIPNWLLSSPLTSENSLRTWLLQPRHQVTEKDHEHRATALLRHPKTGKTSHLVATAWSRRYDRSHPRGKQYQYTSIPRHLPTPRRAAEDPTSTMAKTALLPLEGQRYAQTRRLGCDCASPVESSSARGVVTSPPIAILGIS